MLVDLFYAKLINYRLYGRRERRERVESVRLERTWLQVGRGVRYLGRRWEVDEAEERVSEWVLRRDGSAKAWERSLGYKTYNWGNWTVFYLINWAWGGEIRI